METLMRKSKTLEACALGGHLEAVGNDWIGGPAISRTQGSCKGASLLAVLCTAVLPLLAGQGSRDIGIVLSG